jgi:hypothetical protein
MLRQLVRCPLKIGNLFSNFVNCSGVASGKLGGGESGAVTMAGKINIVN